MKGKDHNLYGAIRRYFDGWEAALLRTGLDPDEFGGRPDNPNTRSASVL